MKLALCGSAPSSTKLAPFRDASYEQWSGRKQLFPHPDYADQSWSIWGCSPGFWATMERADVWFELHRWEPGKPWFSPEYVSFLQTFRGPVYTGGPIAEIQNCVVYPIERVEEEFSAYFLTNSLSLMMALAILTIEDARKAGDTDEQVIGLWGVDMSAGEEYESQRPGVQFFVLEAMRRGIEVYIPHESCLMRPKPIYGISEWDASYVKATARARELGERKAQVDAQLRQMQEQSVFLAGAMDDLNYWVQTWTSPYGLPTGLRLKHTPGTGMGGGITLPRPYSPPPDDVINAGFIQTSETEPDRDEP